MVAVTVGILLIVPVAGSSGSSSLFSLIPTSVSEAQRLWEIWSSRIFVAFVAVILFEYWQARTGKHRPISDSDASVSASTTTTLQYEPMLAAPTIPHSSDGVSNPLLERLENTQRDQRQESSPAQSPSLPPTPALDDEQTVEASNDEPVCDGDECIPMKDTTASELPTESSSPAVRTIPTDSRVAKSTTTPPSTDSSGPRRMISSHNRHPGMDAFCYWYEVQTSLYRIYTLGRHDGVEVAPPYIPHSYRGQTSVLLDVKNQLSTALKVYWVDYKGSHILKGTIQPNQVWHQSTWIDHPWVFEGTDQHGNPTPFLYFIPYRIVPTLKESMTTYLDNRETGLYRFSIIPPTNHQNSAKYYCAVQEDGIMPFSANDHFLTPVAAISWTLQFLSRSGLTHDDPRIDLVQKYLANIVKSPEVVKFRQLRTRSSGTFGSIWNSPLQGLFLAVGFVEEQGFAELGCETKPLPRERIQELALLSYMLTSWKQKETNREWIEQPEGATDGFGRAGYGRVGLS